jgi:hypothetical protein
MPTATQVGGMSLGSVDSAEAFELPTRKVQQADDGVLGHVESCRDQSRRRAGLFEAKRHCVDERQLGKRIWVHLTIIGPRCGYGIRNALRNCAVARQSRGGRSSRRLTPSFVYARPRWVSTVRCEMKSWAAICLLDSPAAASDATSRSRRVSGVAGTSWSR